MKKFYVMGLALALSFASATANKLGVADLANAKAPAGTPVKVEKSLVEQKAIQLKDPSRLVNKTNLKAEEPVATQYKPLADDE